MADPLGYSCWGGSSLLWERCGHQPPAPLFLWWLGDLDDTRDQRSTPTPTPTHPSPKPHRSCHRSQPIGSWLRGHGRALSFLHQSALSPTPPRNPKVCQLGIVTIIAQPMQNKPKQKKQNIQSCVNLIWDSTKCECVLRLWRYSHRMSQKSLLSVWLGRNSFSGQWVACGLLVCLSGGRESVYVCVCVCVCVCM